MEKEGRREGERRERKKEAGEGERVGTRSVEKVGRREGGGMWRERDGGEWRENRKGGVMEGGTEGG